MKILQVVPYFYPSEAFGGSPKVAFEISKVLLGNNNRVVVYTSDAKTLRSRLKVGSSNISGGLYVYYMKNLSMLLARKFGFFVMPQLIRQIRVQGSEFDVIHIHEYRTFQFLIVASYAIKHCIPFIVQAHGTLPSVRRSKIKHVFDFIFGYRLIRNASKVIALSRKEAEQYIDIGVDKERIVVLSNGVDLSQFFKLPQRGYFRTKFIIPFEKKLVLFLGRISETKGIDFLVQAYAYMQRNLHFENSILVIAGPDAGYLKNVKTLVEKLGLNDSVFFVGLLSEVDKLNALVDADIVVNVEPSNVFGLVPLEAAASGKPVVVAKQNAFSSIVVEGKFGFSVKNGQITDLAQVIHNILKDEELSKELGDNGRRFVFKEFGWGPRVSKLEEIYRSAISSKCSKNID